LGFTRYFFSANRMLQLFKAEGNKHSFVLS